LAIKKRKIHVFPLKNTGLTPFILLRKNENIKNEAIMQGFYPFVTAWGRKESF
jgi:hypothetical protein